MRIEAIPEFGFATSGDITVGAGAENTWTFISPLGMAIISWGILRVSDDFFIRQSSISSGPDGWEFRGKAFNPGVEDRQIRWQVTMMKV